MREGRLILGKRKQLNKEGWVSAYVKPSGKFWKRYFNKKVRKGGDYKKGNFIEWC